MPSPFLQRQAIDDSLKVFYINLTVLDATEAVVDKVHNIMHGRRLHMPAPKAWRKAWTKTVAKRAAKHVSRKHVAKLLARKIPPRLIRTMNKRGLSVWAETVFCDHAFVVVQVQVHHVDPVVFAESGVKNQLEKERHRMESRYLPNLIQRQLTGQTQRILRKRLRGRKIITDLQVLLEESQARYFFNHLKVVRHKKTHNMDDGETESYTSDFAEAFTGLA